MGSGGGVPESRGLHDPNGSWLVFQIVLPDRKVQIGNVRENAR